MYFILNSNPESVAVVSRLTANFNAHQSAQALREADEHLDQVERYIYFDNGGDWAYQHALDRATQHCDALFAAHEHNLLKLTWENQGNWKKKIPVHPKAMPTPWKDEKSWAAIFKR